MPRLQAHHLALLVVGLLIVSGTAYAAPELARNTVGSLQVKNNSLVSKDLKNRSVRGKDLTTGAVTSREVRDRSLRRTDLAANALADIRVLIRNVASGTTATFFSDPTIGSLTFTCNGAGYVGTSFAIPTTAMPASVGLSGSDIVDNTPSGAATFTAVSGPGGAVSYSAGGHFAPAGDYFVTTRSAAMHVRWGADTGTTCAYRAEITIDRTTPTGFFPRSARGRSRGTCSSVVGAASCRVG